MPFYKNYKKLIAALLICCTLAPSSSSATFWQSWSKKQKTVALITVSAIGLGALGYYLYTFLQNFAHPGAVDDLDRTLELLPNISNSLHLPNNKKLKEAFYQNDEESVIRALQDESTEEIDDLKCLYTAIQQNLLKVAQYCLSKGANINIKTAKCHLRALHYTCKCGILKTTQFLLQNGADVNAIDYIKRTPLHEACENNKLEIVQLLLQHGANIHAKDEDNQTALDLARNLKHQQIVDHLENVQKLEANFNNALPATPELLCQFIACNTYPDYVQTKFIEQAPEAQKALIIHALIRNEDMFKKLCSYINIDQVLTLNDLQNNVYLTKKYHSYIKQLPPQNNAWYNTTASKFANVTLVFNS